MTHVRRLSAVMAILAVAALFTVTADFGPLRGKRIVRGREAKCLDYYHQRRQADLQHQAVYEIEEELPFDAGPDDPWPDLPAEAPADEADPVTLWRGWERRERLAREQRGD